MKELPFEKALDELEKIVGHLEEGKLPLDEAMTKYEEGVRLTKHCHNKLNDAEKKIELLIKKSDGEFETKPFSGEEQYVPKKVSEKKKKRKQLHEMDNEGLLFS